MGVALPPFGHPDPTVEHPRYDGFTLWVVEDFTEPLDLKHDPIWTYSDGGFQTHRFSHEAISFEPGKMVLTLSEEQQPSSCSFSAIGVVPERAIKSGELRSKHNWFRYGRYEARFKAPSVKPNDAVTNGNYITSLFTYRQPGCQEWREIDLEVTGDGPGHLGTNLITADQDCNFSSDKEQPQFFDLPSSFRAEFQTIGFEWLPTAITFYYLDADAKPVVLRKLVGPKIPQLSAKIMANLWVFDASFAFGGPLGANNEYPFRAEYDFIRFYKWDADDKYPCADMSAACLPAEDVDLSGNNACDGVPFSGDLEGCAQCGTVVRMICTEACE
jgi:beta-glucanase (GH16 family)